MEYLHPPTGPTMGASQHPSWSLAEEVRDQLSRLSLRVAELERQVSDLVDRANRPSGQRPEHHPSEVEGKGHRDNPTSRSDGFPYG